MKYFLYFIIIITTTSCSDKLVGHWHLYNTKSGHFFPMDVINDTLAYRYGNTIYGEYEGVRIRKEKQLNFPGECGSGYYKYKIKKDKIYLNHFESHFEGYKCDTSCCNPITEYTANFLIDIDFTILGDGSNGLPASELNRNRAKSIIIGKPKKEYFEKYGDSIQIEIYGDIISLEGIDDWVEKEKLRYRKGYFEILSFEIIADKNVPADVVKAVINKLRKNGVKRFILTYIKENAEGEMTIEVVKYRMMKWPF